MTSVGYHCRCPHLRGFRVTRGCAIGLVIAWQRHPTRTFSCYVPPPNERPAFVTMGRWRIWPYPWFWVVQVLSCIVYMVCEYTG
jgi:hypothetical protein